MPEQTSLPVAADSKRPPTPDYLNWDKLPGEVLTDGPTVEQVLKISTTSRWRLEKSGELKGYRFGSSKRYRVANVRDLLNSAEVAA